MASCRLGDRVFKGLKVRLKIALDSRLVSVPREEPGLFGSPPFAVRRGLSFSYHTKSFLASASSWPSYL